MDEIRDIILAAFVNAISIMAFIVWAALMSPVLLAAQIVAGVLWLCGKEGTED